MVDAEECDVGGHMVFSLTLAWKDSFLTDASYTETEICENLNQQIPPCLGV